MSRLATIWAIFQGLLLEALPFLLIGVLIAGLARWIAPGGRWLQRLPSQPLLAPLTGAALGFALPACECGNVPVARRLLAGGAPLGSALGFLFAAPVLNPIVLASTWAAFPNQPWLLVDAAQSMGSIPVEEAAAAADIYAFTGHKWCCGPEGLGGVALSERLLEQAQPTLIGWRSLRHEASASSSLHSDARRFEVATSCLPLCSGLTTSLELLAAEGTPAQRLERIQTSSSRLWQGLQTIEGVSTLLPEPPPAGLVSFTLAGLPSAAVVENLGAQGLWIRRLDDPDCLRACTHITTTPSEIETLLTALERLRRA